MVELLVALLLVALNGFFVASEFSIARIRDTQVAEFEARGRRGARSLRHAVDHIDSYLAACQLGITLASIGLGFVGKPAFEKLLAPLTGWMGDTIPGVTAYAASFALAYFIVTLLHVVFGELSPKSLAIARTGTTSLALAPLMRGFYLSTKPMVDAFNAMGNLVLRPFGIPTVREAGHVPHSEDELLALLRQSAQDGLIEPEERDIAERAFEFSEARVREAMVPRTDIAFVTTDMSRALVRERIVQTGHSRLPVCDPKGGVDSTRGIVTAIDLLGSVQDEAHPVAELVRPISIVPDEMSLVRLLESLRHSRQHMALVVDEHGTVQGLVTMEDIVERVFGEIYDEFDEGLQGDDPSLIVAHDDGSFTVPGACPIHELARRGIVLSPGEYTTVAGFVLAHAGRLPAVGETVAASGWNIQVTGVDHNTIRQVRIESRRR